VTLPHRTLTRIKYSSKQLISKPSVVH